MALEVEVRSPNYWTARELTRPPPSHNPRTDRPAAFEKTRFRSSVFPHRTVEVVCEASSEDRIPSYCHQGAGKQSSRVSGSVVSDSVTPQTVACQPPLSMDSPGAGNVFPKEWFLMAEEQISVSVCVAQSCQTLRPHGL